MEKCTGQRHRPTRLLLVDNDPSTFISHRLPLALKAKECGLDVHVATPDGRISSTPDSSLNRELVDAGFTFHPIPLDRKSTAPWREAQTLFALGRLYRRLKPQIVHHLRLKPVLYGGIAARLAGVPAVLNMLTGMGALTRQCHNKYINSAVLAGLRHSCGHPNSRLVLQNTADERFCRATRIGEKARTTVIKGSGVDMSRFVPTEPPPGDVVIMLACRMVWEKGVGEFAAAARALRDAGVRARFVLVGETDSFNPNPVSREQLQAWHDAGILEWWQYRRDMRPVFAASHIVCLPTFYGEGVPKLLIEAAACGRPIVTTDDPGCLEIVRHGENGLVVPRKDTAALIAALGKLIENRNLREKLGAMGRSIAVSEFGLQSVLPATLAIYRELLADSSLPSPDFASRGIDALLQSDNAV